MEEKSLNILGIQKGINFNLVTLDDKSRLSKYIEDFKNESLNTVNRINKSGFSGESQKKILQEYFLLISKENLDGNDLSRIFQLGEIISTSKIITNTRLPERILSLLESINKKALKTLDKKNQ